MLLHAASAGAHIGRWETQFGRLQPLDLPCRFDLVWDGGLLRYLSVPFAYPRAFRRAALRSACSVAHRLSFHPPQRSCIILAVEEGFSVLADLLAAEAHLLTPEG
jgi:hypothetical protein